MKKVKRTRNSISPQEIKSIHVRRSKSAIYSNIDISTCQEERCLEISSEYCCQKNSRKYVR
jgi:hypothetical protein